MIFHASQIVFAKASSDSLFVCSANIISNAIRAAHASFK